MIYIIYGVITRSYILLMTHIDVVAVFYYFEMWFQLQLINVIKNVVYMELITLCICHSKVALALHVDLTRI